MFPSRQALQILTSSRHSDSRMLYSSEYEPSSKGVLNPLAFAYGFKTPLYEGSFKCTTDHFDRTEQFGSVLFFSEFLTDYNYF